MTILIKYQNIETNKVNSSDMYWQNLANIELLQLSIHQLHIFDQRTSFTKLWFTQIENNH